MTPEVKRVEVRKSGRGRVCTDMTGFRNALQDRKSNTWGFLPDDFLHPAYLQANNLRVNLEMSKIQRTFILLVYIVFGEKQAKKMMSQMKGHGGRRKQEDVDAFHFTQDNEELFWDTALPKLCVAKGHNTDGIRLLEEILLSHLICQGTVDAMFKKQDVDETSDNLDRFDVARIMDMVRRNEGWWALLRRFAGWKDKAYHFISGVSEAVVEQLDGAVDKYYDSIYHLGQLSSHCDEVEKSREMVQRKQVELPSTMVHSLWSGQPYPGHNPTVDEHLASGFIRPATSTHVAPVLFIHKKDGSSVSVLTSKG
ncbi:uncharacterized protein EI90DRAFT_3134349 [Cantharellus anzutake]|uniref:uncharacterized protein n=1 Tax=Cantharellus anzutake TaxID=1750568 RepID=UPI0019083188|nr:uncharacterized protein EI90DRAFT_3134349 [Cantharellus anzutake]KAF8316521.1 hypothetical protein EI90DRAFT_3134349 [Cantharellus anzutake]